MFSSTGRFGQIPCPVEDTECSLLTCPFLHQQDAAQRVWLHMPDESYPEPTPKKQKIIHEKVQIDRQVQSDRHFAKAKPTVFVGDLGPHAPQPDHIIDADVDFDTDHKHGLLMEPKNTIRSVTKEISPPPPRVNQRPGGRTEVSVPRAAGRRPLETLNPRLLQHSPAGHQTRLLYLTKIHEEMARLNRDVAQSEDIATKQLALTEDELVLMALDEEEKIAKDNPSVYANVIKLRMVQYKKMHLDQWKLLRQDVIRSSSEPHQGKVIVHGTKVTRARSLNSDLTKAEELYVCRRLIASQVGLQQYGYQTAPPLDSEISKAKDGVRAAHGWEECERCKSRFQVYPDRREDGALTSGGKCTYHWGRMTRLNKDRSKSEHTSDNVIYSCCKALLGTPGCVTAETHVYKVYDAKRLATLLQYETTPENPNVDPQQAVAFDCEMCFTVKGFELVRLTAITWPEGNDLLDVLVRPFGALLDLNSRWSGIWPEEFMNALPWDEEYQSKSSVNVKSGGDRGPNHREPPRIVESPIIARNLLFKYLSPSTPLIGHGIENDLNAARIVHPSIIDTILLYPHPRGMPYRMSLKALVKQHLWRDIQTEGSAGHDSREDAKAAGDLVRLRVIREWGSMSRDGWTVNNGVFVEPIKGTKRAPNILKAEEEYPTGEKRSLPMNYD